MGADTDAAAAQAGAIALLWDQPVSARRGPKPALNLEAIAAGGIGIADADGLAAVTMQRVAAALGVTKMALYRYVPGKAEMVALMIDLAIGEAPRFGGAAGEWRLRLDQWARQMFSRFYRHPWALEATVGPRAIGPNELGWMEEAVVALAGTGLDGGEMLDVAAGDAGAREEEADASQRIRNAHIAAPVGSSCGLAQRPSTVLRTRPSTSVSPASSTASGCSSPAASRLLRRHD